MDWRKVDGMKDSSVVARKVCSASLGMVEMSFSAGMERSRPISSAGGSDGGMLSAAQRPLN